MPLLSLAHLTIMDADPLALIDAGAAAGFDAVGLRIVPPLPTDKIVPVIGDIGLQRAIKRRLGETGLSIFDVEAIWLTEKTNVSELLPALDLGAEIGARYVLSIGFDDERQRMVANFGYLAEACVARGLKLAVEFIPYSCVKNLASAFEIVRGLPPDSAGLLVDALHLSRSGGKPSDIAAYDPNLFPYVHLCDAPRIPPPPDQLRVEARGNRMYPGEGELWLREFLAAFPRETPIAIEAPINELGYLSPAERAKRAADATRKLLLG